MLSVTDLGTIKGVGPLGESGTSIDSATTAFTKFVSTFVGVLTMAAGIWFIFQFFLGAFGYITAGGDKTSVENAQKKMTNALIGLVIVVAAIFLIQIVGKIIGLDILNPGTFILNIWNK